MEDKDEDIEELKPGFGGRPLLDCLLDRAITTTPSVVRVVQLLLDRGVDPNELMPEGERHQRLKRADITVWEAFIQNFNDPKVNISLSTRESLARVTEGFIRSGAYRFIRLPQHRPADELSDVKPLLDKHFGPKISAPYKVSSDAKVASSTQLLLWKLKGRSQKELQESKTQLKKVQLKDALLEENLRLWSREAQGQR